MTEKENANRHKLTFEGKEVTLVGTAHVSRESADLVTRVIEEERPETVCIELCQSRYHAMTQKKKWQDTDLIKVIREKKAFFLLLNFMLSSFQKKIGKKLGIKPGEEIMRAVQSAEEVGSNIHLADRDIRITLSRTWRLMGLWAKLKLMFQFVASVGGVDEISAEDVEKMKNRDVLETLLSEIGRSQPELKRILIDERDLYLASKIRSAPGHRIVAVVGAGHVPGILKNWREPIDIESLEKMPARSRLTAVLKWGIPAAIIVLIITGFFTVGASAGTDMIKYWILANAVLAGLGATIAMAHPLTIVSAIFASPLTSLNPMVAAGWVAGLVEVFFGKPKVRDFESLAEDISSVKGFWRNKITRILMVVVFTNIGSSLGTFVAIPLMVRVFA
ncbi:MAG: TraB/GumN family protein [Deltaproteobacteria bacterium]|nr:TraB/GumN family protein [Deltaproteobacteria bacterium]MBW1912360.1 TraB/GumN family protein [Deltaproteobacteria bacterium]